MKAREYRAKGVAVLDKRGAVLYDLLDSAKEARNIASICNRGIGPEWDAVEPELERLTRKQANRRAKS
jgi:hypothetical protein